MEVVINHMTKKYASKTYGTDNSYAFPAVYDYPNVPYVKSDFRSPECNVTDYNNATEVSLSCATHFIIRVTYE